MYQIREAILVEGRYDKAKLSSIFDTLILETGGFSIFNDRERMNFLRRIAESRGLVILTDSDGAGFVIRKYLKGSISPEFLKQAYIPDVFGKEKRKKTASREGKLGVEGMTQEIILNAVRASGAHFLGEAELPRHAPITKTDFFEMGLSGGDNSATLRKALGKKLGLPENISANAMTKALGMLYDREDVEKALREIISSKKE